MTTTTIPVHSWWWKEYRELRWLTLLAVVAGGLWYWWALSPAPRVQHGTDQEPLAAILRLFPLLLGTGLGAWQTLREHRRDAWALFIHRPQARSHLFRCKWMTGLAACAIGYGLPTLGVILWLMWPDHIPRPWVSNMWEGPLLGLALAWLAHAAALVMGLHHGPWWGIRSVPILATLA
jgi:hypothetical protein